MSKLPTVSYGDVMFKIKFMISNTWVDSCDLEDDGSESYSGQQTHLFTDRYINHSRCMLNVTGFNFSPWYFKLHI